jgi:NADP-dependent 3-hydroxy acid dehydrogenase YdfG
MTPKQNTLTPFRIAIITGASAGIGRALALRLSSSGYRVGLIARRRALVEETADQIIQSGG